MHYIARIDALCRYHCIHSHYMQLHINFILVHVYNLRSHHGSAGFCVTHDDDGDDTFI